MKINSRIKEILKDFGIPVDDGIHVLLGMRWGHVSTFIPDTLKRKLQVTKIYEWDRKSKTLQWNIPLFEEQLTGFEWTKVWMEEFERINPNRKGVEKFVVARMKKFFAEHPEIRKEDVVGATRMYFRSVNDPTYLKSSHKFIMEGRGATRYSMLLDWVEKYRNWHEADQKRNSTINTMQ